MFSTREVDVLFGERTVRRPISATTGAAAQSQRGGPTVADNSRSQGMLSKEASAREQPRIGRPASRMLSNNELKALFSDNEDFSDAI